MRIALLSAEYPPLPGGVGDYTSRLGLALRDLGLDVHVITTRNDSLSDRGPLPCHTVGGWGWGSLAAVQALVAQLHPQFVHIQYQTGAYGMHPAVNLLPTVLRLPVVVTCHDLRLPYLLPKAGWLRRAVTAQLLEHAAAVVVTNEEDAARLRGEIPADRTMYAAQKSQHPYVIPIGSNIAVTQQHPVLHATWRRRMGAPADEHVLVYFGLANQSKGIDLLLRALALLEPTFRLAILGGEAGVSDEGNRRYATELTALIGELGLGGRVWRSGQLAAEDVSAALQAADIAVLPFRDGASYRRGSLLAVLAHGLPLITTQPALPLDPPLRNGDEALFVAGDEATLPAQIAAAVRRLSTDPALQARLSQAARARAASFDWHQIALDHLRLYKQLEQ